VEENEEVSAKDVGIKTNVICETSPILVNLSVDTSKDHQYSVFVGRHAKCVYPSRK